ncbi:unnamed protein product [Vitrella brassicaformis CCMP3155]|uniref:non-specific serine/threonine protein kinase n=2 Tax=Vitrella brassicaformis TaxID=1169539 RepID=A0A0G4H819_VITBC|nr:unnamed protein product [Vitrella brassicaformis CCMP3155]|mmetsp:Transcript_12301/g.29449  ORF Transcript_12301/g.29449 Transcript_12301/m.29449 type:complete len:520 (+) Transcript_12301:248-1807(+)|eukprot:CEM40049.1 unnamed protein product [Vitrella brassicaformis CCMP3155]
MGCSCGKLQPPDEDIRDRYKIGKVLGSGAFGQVRECMLKDTKELRAVKLMEKKAGDKGPWSNESMFKREIALLQKIDHENIIKFFDFYEDKVFLYAVMEKCDGGELFEQVIKRKKFTERDASVLCRQMLSALHYIHSLGIVHRDIKAENFLFLDRTETSPLKMIDFGMSARLEQGQYLNEVCGSPHYLAPELIRRQYNFQADMWALGVLIYLMLYGRYPFDGLGTHAIVKEIMNKKVDWSLDTVAHSPTAVDFMKRLLERSPDRRMDAATALKHPWVMTLEEVPASPKTIPMEVVRSAHRKVTIKKTEVPKSVEDRRNNALKKLEADWAKGRVGGKKISANVYGAASGKLLPEYSRPDKRLSTTPSRFQGENDQIKKELDELRALALEQIAEGDINGEAEAASEQQPRESDNGMKPEGTPTGLHAAYTRPSWKDKDNRTPKSPNFLGATTQAASGGTTTSGGGSSPSTSGGPHSGRASRRAMSLQGTEAQVPQDELRAAAEEAEKRQVQSTLLPSSNGG